MSTPAKSENTEQTLKLWQPRSSRTLSPEDAREIQTNVVGFFSVLREWDRVAQAAEAASTNGLTASKEDSN